MANISGLPLNSIKSIHQFLNKTDNYRYPQKSNLGTPSSNQAIKFNNYQNKIIQQTKLKEGFTNGNLVFKSKQVLANTDIQTTENIKQQYNDTLVEYQKLLSTISGNTSDYINRVSPNNQFLNKTIRFTTGHIAYVTNQGVVKYIPSVEIWDSVKIPKEFIQIDIPWDQSYFIPNTPIPTNPPLISGSTMIQDQSVGNEGTNVYVNNLVTNTNATFQGCFADDTTSPSMTFINGAPSTVSPIINGDFSQPSIEKNTYQYIVSMSSVPGWNFNAALVNEADVWGYPKPYPNGNQCVSIQNEQSISQTLNLSIGTYILSFIACGRNCCDNTNESNPINITLNETLVYNFQPQVNVWSNYKTNINVTTSGNNTITFKGTWTSSDRSSAIQGISIEQDETTSGGNYTFDECKSAAIDGGFPFFSLQNVNYTTSKGFCAVTNNDVAARRNGISYEIGTGIPLWSSNTSGQTGNTSVLSGQGSIDVLNAGNTVIFNTPSKESVNYLGCYGDKKTRTMSLYDKGAYKYNNKACQQIAQDNGSTYYGIQNSRTGENAQCTLGDELSEIKKYGKASNCTELGDGSWSGGWYSNAVYSTNPDELGNYYLILQDDGNMCIYRGSGPNDNQGEIWSASTTGKQKYANPRFAARKGKYGKNWILSGSTLAAGDFIGSNDGSIYLIMQSDGNLVLYTAERELNCKKMADQRIGGGKGANALYKLDETGFPENLFNVAYVDPNADLYTYPNDNIEFANDFNELKGYDSVGNDIQGASYGNATLDNCKTSCINDSTCAGFAYNSENNACYPKNSVINKQMNQSSNLYIRNKKPIKVPVGVSSLVNNIDSVKYHKYLNNGKAVSGLSNATSVQKQQLDQLKNKLDLLANQLVNTTGRFGAGNTDVNNRMSLNTKALEGFTSNGFIKQLNDTRKKIDSYENKFDNIVNNSDIVVLQKNYNYLMWSILAIGTVIVSMNVVRK